VTFTNIDFLGEPEMVETNADMRWKADIQEHQTLLGNKFANLRLGGLPIDSS